MAHAIITDPKVLMAAEAGTIRKDARNRTRVVLVYPNTYPVAMANLGFQTVYGLLNDMDHVVCERAFLPLPGEGSKSVVLRSFEGNRRLSEFDVVAFSVSFENDYPNILSVLDGAGIPMRSVDRTDHHPLIVAGGVACFINPEPVSDFIDCFIIGEAEPVVGRFFGVFDPAKPQQKNLENLASDMDGVYVPAFYPVYEQDAGGPHTRMPTAGAAPTVKRVFLGDLSTASTTSSVVTPHTGFGRVFLVETGRGCPHGCRFCSAGYVYRPLRFRKLDQLARSIDRGRQAGSKIGLVGAAITDLPDLTSLCRYVREKDIRVSFSSLRADRLNEEVISVLHRSGVKTATIAPDAGSERMRQVIKKKISEMDILIAAKRLVAAGIPNLRLYFMVGLPTETPADVAEIVSLCKKIKTVFLAASRSHGRIGTITVSLNPFVPKPFTPFQWAEMADMKTVRQKIKTVRNGLKAVANIRVIAESPRSSYIQGLLSRGDRRMGEILLQVHQNRGDWQKVLKSASRATEFGVAGGRLVEKQLPWEFIDQGFERAMLKREYEAALDLKP